MITADTPDRDTQAHEPHALANKEALRAFDEQVGKMTDELLPFPNLSGAVLANAAKARRLLEALPAWCRAPTLALPALAGTSVGLNWDLENGAGALTVIAGSESIQYIRYHSVNGAFRETSGHFNPDLDERDVLLSLLADAYGRESAITTDSRIPGTTRSPAGLAALKDLETLVDTWRRTGVCKDASHTDLDESAARARRMLTALPDWCPAPKIATTPILRTGIGLIWNPSDTGSFSIIVGPRDISFAWSRESGQPHEYSDGIVGSDRDFPLALLVLLAAAYRRPIDVMEVCR